MRILLVAVLVLLAGDTTAMAKPRTVLDSLLKPAPPTVNYSRGAAPGLPQNAMGTASYSADTDTIYFQGTLDRASRAHETGHAFDDQILTDGDRRYFQRTMGMPAGTWRAGTGLEAGMRSPSEWFADYYAAAVLGLDPERQSEAAYAQVGPKRLARFSKALDRLGRRQGLQPYSTR